jgi:hypothetical protein
MAHHQQQTKWRRSRGNNASAWNAYHRRAKRYLVAEEKSDISCGVTSGSMTSVWLLACGWETHREARREAVHYLSALFTQPDYLKENGSHTFICKPHVLEGSWS